MSLLVRGLPMRARTCTQMREPNRRVLPLLIVGSYAAWVGSLAVFRRCVAAENGAEYGGK